MVRIILCPGRLSRYLLYTVIGLGLVSLSLGLFGTLTGHGRLMGLGPMFDVAGESNIPTWFSASILLLCSVLLGLIAFAKMSAGDRFARHWRILALGMLFLSMDEAASIHEIIGKVMDRIPWQSGLMKLSWVLPVAIMALIVGLMYVRFILHLPASTRRQFLLAVLVFGSGALGLEAVGGIWRSAHGEGGMAIILLQTVEEFLEMAGVVLLVHALTSYISIYTEGVEVRIAEEVEPGPASDAVAADAG